MNQDLQWPVVCVVICTYDRPQIIQKTLAALVERLGYPRLRWHIADDGTGGSYIADVTTAIRDLIGETEYPITFTETNRQGWGANVNRALRHVSQFADYVYFTEDDYVLLRPLDLRPHIALMEMEPSIGYVRYGIASHWLNLTLGEVDISSYLPDYQESQGIGSQGVGKVNYLKINMHDVTGGPFAFYRYSNRPHLKHTRFHQAYGFYQEGLPLAQTEHAMNHQIASLGSGPSLVCPADWIPWYFDHIGVSRQGTDLDKESSNG